MANYDNRELAPTTGKKVSQWFTYYDGLISDLETDVSALQTTAFGSGVAYASTTPDASTLIDGKLIVNIAANPATLEMWDTAASTTREIVDTWGVQTIGGVKTWTAAQNFNAEVSLGSTVNVAGSGTVGGDWSVTGETSTGTLTVPSTAYIGGLATLAGGANINGGTVSMAASTAWIPPSLNSATDYSATVSGAVVYDPVARCWAVDPDTTGYALIGCRFVTLAAEVQVLSGGTASGMTTVDCSPVVPVGAKGVIALVRMGNNSAASACGEFRQDSSIAASKEVGGSSGGASSFYSIQSILVTLTDSLTFQYRQTTGGNTTVNIWITDYWM